MSKKKGLTKIPTFSLRDYQEENADILTDKLKKLKIVAFVAEVRSGKTLTALEVASNLKCKKVLFVTKKKAMSSIVSDHKLLNPDYELIVINYESVHKIDSSGIDMLVCDESHSFSSFPKPSKRCKQMRDVIKKNKNPYVLLLSGTFSPESFSQCYHQFFISPNSPFKDYSSFYKWSHVFVNIKKKRIGQFFANDYSCAYEDKIDEALKDHILSFTQKQAGFKSKVVETIHYVKPHPPTLKIIRELVKNKIVEGSEDVIIADSGAKMSQKLHELWSGSIRLDSGKRIVLNTVKAEYIKNTFKNKRLAIIYKFVAELEAIKTIFGDSLTNDLEEFQASNTLHFAGQIASTKEGTNLSQADLLVMYTPDHSASSYFQARARLSTKERPETNVAWIFTEGGVEKSIYNTVSIDKKDYTLSYFKKYLATLK